jgi:16S rRNA (cytosine967-C5)-methyltransferase
VTDQELAATVAEGGRLRALVLELWQRTRMDWGFVTDRLAVTFRKEKWLGASERRFVGDTLYGLVRNLRRVDLALERARATSRAPRDLERLIALLVLERQLAPQRATHVVPELDWQAALGVDDAIAHVRDRTQRIALAASLPDWLAARLVADWGDEAEALARALDERAPMTVRANLLVVRDREELAGELASASLATHPGAHCDTALIVDTRTNLFAQDAFRRGAFEAQDEGSQLLADVVVAAAASPKPLVIDYCAGAGGKTLAIAARLRNRGRIIATDVDAKKLEELRRRARRAKVTNAQAMAVDDRALDAFRGKADVVFVDAPCSGIGALRRNPEARWRLRESDVPVFAARQREILAAAASLCAPTGRLVYATCSLLAAENEDVVADLTAIPLEEILGRDRAAALGRNGAFTATPHQHGTDGFFAVVANAPRH